MIGVGTQKVRWKGKGPWKILGVETEYDQKMFQNSQRTNKQNKMHGSIFILKIFSFSFNYHTFTTGGEYLTNKLDLTICF